MFFSPLVVTLCVGVIARSLGFRVSKKYIIGYGRIQITVNLGSRNPRLTRGMGVYNISSVN